MKMAAVSGSAAVSVNVIYFLQKSAPDGRLGVRQLAAAFALIPIFIGSVKAAASCRTPRASPPLQKVCGISRDAGVPGITIFGTVS
jgi:hypothetical protein